MSGAEPTIEEVGEALRKSGYLMEQEIASRVEGLGFQTRTNFPYVDSDENKSREMDVAAYHQFYKNEDKKVSGFVELIIECKQSNFPYAFISRNKMASDYTVLPEEFAFSKSRFEIKYEVGGSAFVRFENPFHNLGIDKIHYSYDRPEKTVQFCRIDRSGKNWNANHAGLYDSIFLPLTKALSFRKSKLPVDQRGGQWNHVWIFIPMVVVKGKMYKVQSHIDPEKIEEIKHVTFSRDIYVGNEMKRYSVEFISSDYLETFIGETLNPFLAKFIEILSANPEILRNGRS